MRLSYEKEEENQLLSGCVQLSEAVEVFSGINLPFEVPSHGLQKEADQFFN